ncbi:MAG: TIGR01906 family membrane protein [bacterium]
MRPFVFVVGLLSFVFLTISSIILLISLSPRLYVHGFEKYDVYATLSLSKEDVNREGLDVVSYLKGGISQLDAEFFSQQALVHMEDVRGLFAAVRWLFYLSLVFAAVVIGYLLKVRKFDQLGGILIWSGVVLIGFVLLLGLFSLTGWEEAFTRFHKIFFRNDLWLFDPSDTLILLFPDGFFQDMFMYMATGMAVFGVVVAISGMSLLRFWKVCVTMNKVST